MEKGDFGEIDSQVRGSEWAHKRKLMKSVLENNAQQLATAMAAIPMDERERCLWSCHGGANILEWAIMKGRWNSAHVLAAYLYGISEEILQMIDYDTFTVGADCWNSVFEKTIKKYQKGEGAVGQVQIPGLAPKYQAKFKQRMHAYKIALDNDCFDIFQAATKYPLTVMGLLTLGADVRNRSDKNETLPAIVVQSNINKGDTIRLLDYFATLDPNINHELSGQDQVPPFFFCLQKSKKYIYDKLKRDEDFKVVSTTGKTILDYTSNISCFAKEEVIKILKLNPTALNSTVKKIESLTGFQTIWVLEALQIIAREGRQGEYTFSEREYPQYLISLLVQLGFDSNIEAFTKAKKRILLPNKESGGKAADPSGCFPIDLLPKEIIHMIFTELMPLDAVSLSMISKIFYDTINHWEWQQIFAKTWPLKKIKQKDQIDWKNVAVAHHRVLNNWRKGKYQFKVLVSAILHLYYFNCDENWAISVDYNYSSLFNCQKGNNEVLNIEHAEKFNNNVDPVPEMFDHVTFINSDPDPHLIPTLLAVSQDHLRIYLLHHEYDNHQLTVLNNIPAVAFNTNYTSKVSFLNYKQQYVLGPRMHTIDLNSLQVVSSLPETYSLLGATPNLFDQRRTSVGFDIDSLYMFDVNTAVVNQFERNGAHVPIQEVHMIDENTMLAVTSNSRLYCDIRKLDKEIAVFHDDRHDSVVVDVPNHRMAYMISRFSLPVVVDITSGLIERVLPTNDEMNADTVCGMNTQSLFIASSGGSCVNYLDFNM